MKMAYSQPVVLTVQNVGDVMYGPMPKRADLNDCITAANNVYWRACRDLDSMVLKFGAHRVVTLTPHTTVTNG